MKKVLITGGAGYIGSVMTARFLERGYKVTVVDNLRLNQNSLFGYCYHPNFHFHNKDARDKRVLKDLIKDVDYIIPLAGLVGCSVM
jgi:nucleoside-diphosphate-sugar epimerase